MRPSLSLSVPEIRAQAVWQAPGAVSDTCPDLLPALVRCRPDLLARVATYAVQLRTFPRQVRRALRQQWRVPLVGMALVLALGQQPAQAARIPVTADCSLADAIRAANSDQARGGCPAGSGADTIVLPAGSTQTLTDVHNSTFGPTGLPVVRSPITIVGQGSTIIRDSAAPGFRILAVSRMGDLTLQETTVSGGGNFDGDGLGIFNRGTLTVTNSTISGNDSYGDGARVHNNGGGIFNDGTLTVTNSTISDNYPYGDGGGIFNHGTLTVTNSTISGNEAFSGGGGGIFNDGTLTVTNSTLANNSALSGAGGGIANTNTLTVTNSTISSNLAVDSGGGIYNSGICTVTNSTISGNQTHGGGGIYNSGTLTVTNSTISGNRNIPAAGTAKGGGGIRNSGFLTLVRTLTAGNFSSNAPEVGSSGTVFASHHNLFGVGGNAGVGGFTPGPTDIVPPLGVPLADILVPTLADHGGPTLTYALVPQSLARNAGLRACTTADEPPLRQDQRGVLRPQEGACDIGAYEFLPTVLCHGRLATLVGAAQADVLLGTAGNDVIQGLGGDDLLLGRGGDDMLCGGAGNDTLRGGPGNDQLFGGRGDDTLEGGPGDDACDGNAGTDTHAGGCEVLRNLP